MTSTASATGSYIPLVGLEVHAQLLTRSKMFCGCDARYWGASPNSHVCPVDLGLPGSLPVINQAAIDDAIMVALALNCRLADITRFDRKNYPYPDIPKGYQISQYDTPLARNGYIEFDVNGETQRVGITRVHLEEDTGKTIHAAVDGREVSLVDYNRSGVPLLEIVSEPDINSSDAAREYFAALREILVYLRVNSGDMQAGALRADVNVSVSKKGHDRGTKIEVKNLNSFRSVARAVEYEIARQIDVLEAGGFLSQETRGWDEAREVTVGHRSKEYAEDYRYFPEPDLPPLYLSREKIESIRAALPELAQTKRHRFMAEYGLSPYDAVVLTRHPALAELLDETVGLGSATDKKPLAKTAANWLTGEFLRLLNERQISVEDSRVTPEGLAGLLEILEQGRITNAMAKTVFEEMFTTGKAADAIVAEQSLDQIEDRSQLIPVVQKVIDENPNLASDYRTKDRKTEGPLVGKVMTATRGKANPAIVKVILADLLDSTS